LVIKSKTKETVNILCGQKQTGTADTGKNMKIPSWFFMGVLL